MGVCEDGTMEMLASKGQCFFVCEEGTVWVCLLWRTSGCLRRRYSVGVFAMED